MMSKESLMGLAPTLRDDADIRRLKLSATEGFLLSQVDGITPAGVLSDLVAMDEATLTIALQRLEKLGVIRWARRQTDPGDGRAQETTEQRQIVQQTREDPALTEVCELSRDERLQILKAEREWPRQTYWEILRLAGEPTPSDVKRAYFVASKSFHPDRFFGRDLGSFRDRLEKIFHLLTQAHTTLSNDEKRVAYRARHPPPRRATLPTANGASAPSTPSNHKETSEQREARIENRRQEILAERKARRFNKHMRQVPDAVPANVRRAQEMYQTGLGQLQTGDVFAAAVSFKLAMTYDPNNSQFLSMFEEANGQAMLEHAHRVAEQAETSAATGAVAESARLFMRAFEMAPNKAEYAMRAAEQLLAADDIERAQHYAAQAVESAPKRKEARVLVAAVMEAAGDRRTAIEQLRVAETLDPTDAHVKKALKRLAKSMR
ncbi:DnaJ domain-containing protein [Myxococcota bacterium]